MTLTPLAPPPLPPHRVLSPTNVRRSFIPTKFWQIFKKETTLCFANNVF